MTYETAGAVELGDNKILANLIIELNIARRNSRAYPVGHPLIDVSLHKVLAIYAKLFETQQELVVGVTRDALMMGDRVLEKSNLIYRDFALVLFERGIGTVIFHGGLQLDELKNFMSILGLKRDDILQQGGIGQVWERAQITSITIRPVRYDLLSGTDEEFVSSEHAAPSAGKLWERFACSIADHGVARGTGSPHELDPEKLASILNRQFADGGLGGRNYRESVRPFLHHDQTCSPAGHSVDVPYDKLASFIDHLDPDLRRHFLMNSFESISSADQHAMNGIVAGLSETTVLQTLDDMEHNAVSMPPVIKGLLQRLGQQITTHRQEEADKVSAENDFADKIKTIFREHASEEFVPESYQQKLDRIMVTSKIADMQLQDCDALIDTLETGAVESHIGEILLNLLREGFESAEEAEILLQNLDDMLDYVLQTGDYGKLITMIEQLMGEHFPVEVCARVQQGCSRQEFLEEVVNGLTIWGKPRFKDIQTLIRTIGSPFIDLLLDRLSEEKNMSLRRFYMDCLIEMGSVTHAPIVRRLSDNRWYFIRNLLIILVAQEDPSIVGLIRPLLDNPDQRVRNEALKALVHFRDPESEKLIVQGLGSHNSELQLASIQLAEKCSSSLIFGTLLSMLSKGGFSQDECEMSSAIIRVLGEMGRAEALPELAKILSSRSLLHSRNLARLKIDVVKSLELYPVNLSRPVLERLINGGNREIAAQAQESLRTVTGHSS